MRPVIGKTDRRTPPWPAAVTAGLLALATLSTVASVVVSFVLGFPIVAVPLLVLVAVFASTTEGVWRGRRGARVSACVIGVAVMLVGLQQLGESGVQGLLPVAIGGLLAI